MSNLSTLSPSPGSQTRKTRLARGRGSGVGGTSGRGMNGQNSRTGTGKRYPTFEGGQTPLFRRTPKKRGFTAYKPEQYVVVNLDQIEALAIDGVTTVDYAILYERRIIREKGKLLKLLGRGEVKTAFTVTADAVSAGARASIEKAGGTVSVSEPTISE
ncbi:50S ribosomal protein L15 [Candidatus Gracilibacteria bacterium]|nr:50S ribosomal protein L15 [Candidatus Gracilibacteria bacterium]